MPNQPKINKRKLKVVIVEEWCKGCRICVEFCPKESLRLNSNGKAVWINGNDCIRCGLCELRCPDAAIVLLEEV